MNELINASLSHDVIHGYIPFTSPQGLPEGEVSEQAIIDHPWIQRLRQIHQLQTAWWVFPTAEHTRFQHVLGAMHLASRMIEVTYDSLRAGLPGRAQPRLRRVARADGGPFARRGARALWSFFRQPLPEPNTSSITRLSAAGSFSTSWPT